MVRSFQNETPAQRRHCAKSRSELSLHAPCPGKWTSTVTARCPSTEGRACSVSRGPPEACVGRHVVSRPVWGRCLALSAGCGGAGWWAAAPCTPSVTGFPVRASLGFGPRPLRTGRRRGRRPWSSPQHTGGLSRLPSLADSQRTRSRGSRKRAACEARERGSRAHGTGSLLTATVCHAARAGQGWGRARSRLCRSPPPRPVPRGPGSGSVGGPGGLQPLAKHCCSVWELGEAPRCLV